MRFKFPIIGHGFGPGGNLSFPWRKCLERRKRTTVASHAAAYAAQVEVELSIGRTVVAAMEDVICSTSNGGGGVYLKCAGVFIVEFERHGTRGSHIFQFLL